MRDVEKRQDTSRFAEQALATIASLGLPPTPENFTVWYLHHAGSHPALSHAIRQLESRQSGVTAEEAAALHRSICTPSGSSQRRPCRRRAGRRAGRRGQPPARCRDSQTRDYSERLSTLGNGLSGTIDHTSCSPWCVSSSSRTELMSERVSSLQNELSQSSREIENLAAISPTRGGRRARSTDRHRQSQAVRRGLAREAREATMTGEPLALLVADIDHFKAFNDTHGHQIGDVVLKLVADRLKRSVKGRDTVVRYGGEEFAVSAAHHS
ncbi:MAG: GGDEF domain-containing protein [Geminicoccaceae bacterium]